MKTTFRLARMKVGLTQKEAAALLQVSAAYLCRIERNDIDISDNVLCRMRKLYNDYTLTKES
ncbi:helix-turn-helix domain-containing protein [Anaerosinus massiliensis]|uniref:helix-turn-helix domain-containing protein n=1 Tax=Massilibacillus massiliensis TaxID=1806837 RepID=UPI000DA63BF5|nr:helix-turn-helix transcriptional regulator [Massilibacillus massiliensis]